MELKWRKITEITELVAGQWYLLSETKYDSLTLGYCGEAYGEKYIVVEGKPTMEISDFDYYALVCPLKSCANCSNFSQNYETEKSFAEEYICEYYSDFENLYTTHQCHCCEHWDFCGEEE